MSKNQKIVEALNAVKDAAFELIVPSPRSRALLLCHESDTLINATALSDEQAQRLVDAERAEPPTSNELDTYMTAAFTLHGDKFVAAVRAVNEFRKTFEPILNKGFELAKKEKAAKSPPTGFTPSKS